MRRTIVACLAVIGLLAVGIPAAGQDVIPEPDRTPGTCSVHSAKYHIKKANQKAKQGWAERRWRRGPGKSAKVATRHISCLLYAKDRRAAQRLVKKQRTEFRRYKVYRSLTPYQCGRGLYSYWAIECYIISCESGFSWGAANPSGAVGPYQLLGWGAPFPVRGWKDKIEHHRIAASIWGGPGDSDWAQCL